MLTGAIQERQTEALSRDVHPVRLLSVDCSGMQTAGYSVLLDWVRSRPAATQLHVIVPSSAPRQPENRQLRSSLQLLGCTVTARMTQKSVQLL
ncbi:MAG: hypothetical protein WCG83_05410 [Candidatus Peregrinibacteria bacterium]